MGQNSQEVAYGFGQLGSAYSDIAKPIIPPQGMVIVAIQFLADNVPTIMTPEKLDKRGPGFAGITGTTTDAVAAADKYINFNGFTSSACTGIVSQGNNVEISVANNDIKVGQYVLLVNNTDTESGGLTIDSETPIPIYKGPNRQGVRVIEYLPGSTRVRLSEDTTPTNSQTLIFLGPQQGAGGITAASQQYPKGAVIYGRWTAFQGDGEGAVICYFGQ